MPRHTVYPIAWLDGAVVAEHVRTDFEDGSKSVMWRRPGLGDGLHGLPIAELPLYGTERLAGLHVGRTVIVTEGEKAAEALWHLGANAVGTVTGAASVPGEDALAVLLAFDVVLWPDYDEPGDRHMTRVAASLIRLGGSARRLHWGGATNKGDDAADFAVRGGDAGLLRLYVDAASPWHVEPQKAAPRPRYDTLDHDSRVQAAKAHLIDVVMSHLGPPVSQQNRAMWWRCPFHDERTASFKVDLKEPFFVCFGCGERGDVFTFLRRMAGADFKAALRELAPVKPLGGVMPL